MKRGNINKLWSLYLISIVKGVARLAARRIVGMKKTEIFESRRMWVWFIVISLSIGFFVALLSGSLQFRQNIRAGASFEVFREYLDERIPFLMEVYQIPGCSVALVRNQEIAWTQAYGYADLESGRILTTETPMSTQSISKSVTAWGIMKLAENDLIDLDSPVSQYLKSWDFPQSRYSAETITVRQLLNHTAGMPLGDFFSMYAPDAEMPSLREKLTEGAILIWEPGTKFSYSNTGYNLLELVIEEVTEQSFSEYMHLEVLLPLGMTNSFFTLDTTRTPYPPTGYDLSGNPVAVYVYPQKGSGGLFATAEDIARFAVAGMRDNSVLSVESINALYTPENRKIGVYGLVFDAYGLGHYLEILQNGSISVSHGGQGSGVMTHFQAVPETGDAIVILTNSQRSWPFIANLLTIWARWRDFPSVGMGMIIWGQYGMSLVVGLLLSASLLMILRLITGFCKRKQASVQLFQAIVALVLLGVLFWCVCQPYLFLTSIFPILSIWLGRSIFVVSIVMLFSAFVPLYLRKKEWK